MANLLIYNLLRKQTLDYSINSFHKSLTVGPWIGLEKSKSVKLGLDFLKPLNSQGFKETKKNRKAYTNRPRTKNYQDLTKTYIHFFLLHFLVFLTPKGPKHNNSSTKWTRTEHFQNLHGTWFLAKMIKNNQN